MLILIHFFHESLPPGYSCGCGPLINVRPIYVNISSQIKIENGVATKLHETQTQYDVCPFDPSIQGDFKFLNHKQRFRYQIFFGSLNNHKLLFFIFVSYTTIAIQPKTLPTKR